MLLRNASSQDRDPDIFHTMTSHNPAADDMPTGHPTENGNDDNNNNNLDDIWDTSDHHPHHHHYPVPHHHHQPPLEVVVSDIPRLTQAHSTAGYRDGITLAKSRTAQQGFDEGYGLGANLGARAGQLLGVLEGLAAAVGLHALSSGSARGGQGRKEEARRLEGLLTDARRELGVKGVFDGAFWAADGNWRYQVGGQDQFQQQGGMVEMGEVVFADVAEAHPLLRKWSGIVRAEAARYGVDWEVLKDEVGEGRGEEEEE
ncbi:hypothetical protein C8A01DRAFT_34555, partial [Parachaetomium inaequale]